MSKFLLLLMLCFTGFQVSAQAEFNTTWKTDNPGISNSTSITIPTVDTGYNFDVDWENDGIFDDFGVTGNITHDYGLEGTYTVAIRGDFPRIYFNNSGDRQKILSVDQWGSNAWTSMNRAFRGCTNLVVAAIDVPDLSNVTDMSYMFGNTASFNQNIGNWNVSNVTEMRGLFASATAFNRNISTWNVSNVIDMSFMFFNASSFNQDISAWNVSNVADMTGMFANASRFNQDLGTWNVANVTDMYFMFNGITLTTENYDALLIGWNTLTLQNGVTFDAGNSKYCHGKLARENIINTYDWTIIDGGLLNPPVAICKDITIELDVFGNATITADDVDDGSTMGCTGTGTLSVSPSVFDCSNIGPNTVTLTVTDSDGNTSSCNSTVTVEDNMAPVITCVPNDTRNTDAGVCEYTVMGTEFDATFTDNCNNGTITNDYNGNATLAGEILPKGFYTIVWTVDDGNGQTATCTTEITIEDNEDPVIACIPNASRDTDPGVCEYTIVGTELDATFSDNCTDGTITNDYNGTATMADEVLPKGVYTIIWTADDGNGQTASCTTVITVEDNEDPIVTCVPNATRETDPGLCQYTVIGTEFDATFTDNCTDGSITNDFNGTATLAGAILPKGINTIVWTADDGNGQTASCTTVVTIEDNEDPVITCVPNATRDTDPGLCQYMVVGTEFDATFTDNCLDGTITNNYTGTATMAGAILPKGITTIVWTVDDGNGQTATCNTIVTVEDNEDPTISCVPDATRDTNTGVCDYTVVGSEFDATFTDNCTDGTISNNYNGTSTLAGEILPRGVTTVIWTVMDGNGQTATCTTIITIEDNEDPTIACMPNAIRNTDSGICGYTVVGNEFDATFSDNCTNGNISNDFNGTSTLQGAVLPTGSTTILWTATDGNGQAVTCSTTITVEDIEAPTAVCQNITIALDASGNATITASQIDGGSTDACGIASTSIDVTSFDCSNVGTNDVILTVTDNNGNTSTCTAVVTVEDVTAPVVSCQNITVILDPVTGMATITEADILLNSTDACGIAGYALDVYTFDCSNVGVNQVVLTVTDVNGNMASCNATVTVEDITSPVLICQDFTLELGVDGTAVLNPNDVIASNDDVCGIYTVAVDITEFSCADIGSPIAVEVFSQDNSGNISSCMAMVTVVDMLAPEITCPANQTVDPGANNLYYIVPDYVASGQATAVDNCTNPAIILQNPPVGTPLSDGTYTISITAKDVYGNTSNCEFELTVESMLGTGDNNQNLGSISMYPNPAKGQLTIANPQSLDLEKATIYDLTGRVVQSFNLKGMATAKTLNIDQLAAATYVVIIEGQAGQITKRLIKQ